MLGEVDARLDGGRKMKNRVDLRHKRLKTL
jgi:hypothetical protein